MDSVLADRLNKLTAQNKRLRDAEELFLELEANKKPLLAQLILKSPGKSFAEREAQALASEDWINFIKFHVMKETEFNFEKRKYAILEQAYYAELNTYKREDALIKRGAS